MRANGFKLGSAPGFDIIATEHGHSILDIPQTLLLRQLKRRGAVLFRGFRVDLGTFSAFVRKASHRTAIDPARAWFAPDVQRVDAGTAAVGLHCENGTTPRVPDVVWFYAAIAAREGSQTTLCEGRAVWYRLAPAVKRLFLDHQVLYERTVPEDLWTRYLQHEMPSLPEGSRLDQAQVDRFCASVPGTRMTVNLDRSLSVSVCAALAHPTRFSPRIAWANSLLGPSYNYQAPRITLDNGRPIPAWALEEITRVTDACTEAIPWQDGDVVAIDNTRTMHGRRKILDCRRTLYTALSYV